MKYYLIAICLLFSFSACVHLEGFSPRTELLRKLDSHLARNEYDAALGLLEKDQVVADKEELSLEKSIVMGALAEYEKEVVAQALELERQGNWAGARNTYSLALRAASGSRIIQDARKEMAARFNEKMDSLESEELISTGEWLKRELVLLGEMHKNDPDNNAVEKKYLRMKNDAAITGSSLLALGEKRLESGDMKMAMRIIPLAKELSPGPDTERVVALFNSVKKVQQASLKNQKDKKRKSKVKVAQEKDARKIMACQEAMAYGRLAEARSHLDSLSAAARDSEEVIRIYAQLDREIQEYVEDETSIGSTFYRIGEYELAIKSWESVISLDPENKAVSGKLERARRIVEKLDSLRDRQSN